MLGGLGGIVEVPFLTEGLAPIVLEPLFVFPLVPCPIGHRDLVLFFADAPELLDLDNFAELFKHALGGSVVELVVPIT
eukprot:12445515-Alexandrium_andersonii.AAC.1